MRSKFLHSRTLHITLTTHGAASDPVLNTHSLVKVDGVLSGNNVVDRSLGHFCCVGCCVRRINQTSISNCRALGGPRVGESQLGRVT